MPERGDPVETAAPEGALSYAIGYAQRREASDG